MQSVHAANPNPVVVVEHSISLHPLLRTATARWLQFVVGMFLFGLAVALMIRSDLGLGPWDAFHVGLNRLTGISIGGASILMGVVIVTGTCFLGIRPGAGTLANMVLIGVFMDLLLPWIPVAGSWGLGLAYYAAGIGLAGFSTGLYIAMGLGNGPRDGLMLGLSLHTGWPVRRVRTLLEVGVLWLGWLMGGHIGVGTLLFTLSIGPAAQWGLQLFGVLPSRQAAPVVEPGPAGARRTAA